MAELDLSTLPAGRRGRRDANDHPTERRSQKEQHMKVKTKIKAGDGTHGCDTCLPPVHYP